VHCVAGLGRAPFLVAIALVNNGCSPFNAIDLIRKNRPGALNLTQANYILEFKGSAKKVGKNGSTGCQCNIF
jgi:protein tyrosine phosphatase type 4A